MTTDNMSAGADAPARAMARLVNAMGYEVMPFKGTEDAVVRHVPTQVPLSVTTTEGKGLGPTVDLAVRLRQRGYDVAPHLAARLFRDDDEVAALASRLKAEGVERVFVIGGDAATPAGKFPDALGLLQSLDRVGHSLRDVGIGGYPEGHGTIAVDIVESALRAKAAHATRVVTQICFSAESTVGWARSLSAVGVDLPVHVGLPGPVNRQKLIRISTSLGLGPSARFLSKQQGWWRFLVPGAYNPSRLVRGLASADEQSGRLAGLHVFTFNELQRTEEWRCRLMERWGDPR